MLWVLIRSALGYQHFCIEKSALTSAMSNICYKISLKYSACLNICFAENKVNLALFSSKLASEVFLYLLD